MSIGRIPDEVWCAVVDAHEFAVYLRARHLNEPVLWERKLRTARGAMAAIGFNPAQIAEREARYVRDWVIANPVDWSNFPDSLTVEPREAVSA